MNDSPQRPTRLIVSYIADDRGHDALALASFLATGIDAEIIITLVLPEATPFGGYSGVLPTHDPIILEQVERWGAEARAEVPAGIPVTVEHRVASTEAHGVIDAAAEHDADLIVVGTEAAGVLRRFTIGTVANTLLHASPIPVALAPGGFRELGPVARVNAIYGTRPGAEEVIGWTLQRALVRKVPFRALSLVPVDRTQPELSAETIELARTFGGERLAQAGAKLTEEGRAHVEVIEGDDIEDALSRVHWQAGDLAYLGSSRLAGGHRVFLGSHAHAILQALPVPAIVVPRGVDDEIDEAAITRELHEGEDRA